MKSIAQEIFAVDLLVVDTYQQFYCVRRARPGARIDYAKFLDKLKEDYNFQGMKIAYVAMITRLSQNFVNSLQDMGYLVNARAPRKNVHSVSFNFDVDLTIKVMDYKPTRLFLGSTAHNLVPLMKYCKTNGIEVIVYGEGIPRTFKKYAETKGLDADVFRYPTPKVDSNHSEIPGGDPITTK